MTIAVANERTIGGGLHNSTLRGYSHGTDHIVQTVD
jgi:hypothetical protein